MNNCTRNLNIGSLSVQNVISDDIKQHILDKLDNVWKRKTRIFTDEHKNVLSKKCYITFQPIGTQYYLYLTKYNNINSSFLISKKTSKNHKYPQIILLHMGFSEFVYQKDTVFDVNMVKHTNEQYSLVITDIILKRGERMDKDIIERYNSIIDLLNNEYIEYLEIQQFSIDCTPIYHHNEIDNIFDKYIDMCNYKVNGFYIHNMNNTFIHILPRYNDRLGVEEVKMEQKYVKPIQEKQMKEKMLNTSINMNKSYLSNNLSNNIILQIRTTDLPDIYHLYADNDEYIGIANIPSLKISKLIKNLLKDDDHSYVECKYNSQFEKWEPMIYSEKPISDIKTVKLFCENTK